jgi:hypothetical protein
MWQRCKIQIVKIHYYVFFLFFDSQIGKVNYLIAESPLSGTLRLSRQTVPGTQNAPPRNFFIHKPDKPEPNIKNYIKNTKVTKFTKKIRRKNNHNITNCSSFFDKLNNGLCFVRFLTFVKP